MIFRWNDLSVIRYRVLSASIKARPIDAVKTTVNVGLVLKMPWLYIQVTIQAYQRSNPALIDRIYHLTSVRFHKGHAPSQPFEDLGPNTFEFEASISFFDTRLHSGEVYLTYLITLI